LEDYTLEELLRDLLETDLFISFDSLALGGSCFGGIPPTTLFFTLMIELEAIKVLGLLLH